MAKRIFFGAPFLVCLAFLATGALPRQVRSSLASAPDHFVPQPPTTSQAPTPADLDGARLLDCSLTALREMRWLRTTIWQRLHDDDNSFESTALLLRGPGHCARLEATVTVGAASCQRLVISDGEVLAEVQRWSRMPENVVGHHLPRGDNSAARDAWLRNFGCVGPLPLIEQVRVMVPAWNVRPGLWCDRPVLRLDGALHLQHLAVAALRGLSAQSCRLYLDARSLWPIRLEWYAGAVPGRSPLRSEIEFRDPEINRALAPEECARAFTYNRPVQ